MEFSGLEAGSDNILAGLHVLNSAGPMLADLPAVVDTRELG
jgi:hypothetical protein